MALKKPTPPSKYASQAVKDAYQTKLEEWQREQSAKKSAKGPDSAIADPVPVAAVEPLPADRAGRATTGADSGVVDGSETATGEPGVGLDIVEVIDPTVATPDQYQEQLAALRQVMATHDDARHDELQQLADWVEAYESIHHLLEPSEGAGPIAGDLIDSKIAELADALADATSQALPYTVVCDATNNPADSIADGRLTVDVDMARIVLSSPVSDPSAASASPPEPASSDAGGATGAVTHERRTLSSLLMHEGVTIHTTSRDVAAELVRLGLSNVFLDYPDRSAEPLHVARSIAESLPPLNTRSKRYRTKSGQTQNLGGVVVPGGPDGLVLPHDDHRLSGFIGYFLDVEDVGD